MVKKYFFGTITDRQFKRFVVIVLTACIPFMLSGLGFLIKINLQDHYDLQNHLVQSEKLNSQQSEDIKNLFRNQGKFLQENSNTQKEIETHEKVQEQWKKDLEEKVDKIDHKVFRGFNETTSINIRDDKPVPMGY